MNQFLEQREKWTIEFKAMSDAELINSFNGKVGLKTFGVLLSIHLQILENEMISRNWDYSEVISTCHKTHKILSTSYAFPIKIVNNKLITIKNYFWFNREKIYLN